MRDVTLIRGDGIEYVTGLEDGAVDCVLTDPPYAERTHAGARTTVSGHSFDTKKLVGFDSLDDATFLRFCRAAVRASRRWVVMTCDWRHAAAAEADPKIPVVRLGVFVKPDGSPQFTGDRPGTGWEAVLVLHREGKKRWNGGGHHAVWTFHCERGRHPTQKPVPLFRKWVRQFTDPGETVLDPFAGSGTTGEACALEGRKCVLVEKEEKWCAEIRKRLARHLPDPELRHRKTGEEVLF